MNEMTTAHWPNPPKSNASVRTLTWLTIVGVTVAISVLVLGVVVMLQARAEAWQQACQSADNLVLALERDIGRHIAVLDLSLQGAADALQEPGLAEATPEVRRSAIFDRAASAEYLSALLVTDASGAVTQSSRTDWPQQIQITDRDYFTVQRDRSDAGLYVSQPFRSRVRGGAPTIALSRRIDTSTGAFAGIVAGTLDIAYFDHLFEKLDVGRGGVLSLIRTDGRMVARLPSNDATLGLDVSGSDTFRRMIATHSGHYVGPAAVDGVTRLYSFSRVGNLPLILSVGLSTSDITSAWLTRSVIVGGALALLCIASLILLAFFRREMLRRLKAESALAERAESLAILAATDGLTGLGNRLAFDGELTRAWRQGVRARGCLALLMVDADCFKTYNDRYGHPAGDKVLREVASCIADAINRPLDFAARYGGEEFSILLPETNLEGGVRIADKIRRAVEELKLPHQDNSSGIVTISVGVAVAHPRDQDSSHHLVREADNALYDSKARGRNRVTAARNGSLATKIRAVAAERQIASAAD